MKKRFKNELEAIAMLRRNDATISGNVIRTKHKKPGLKMLSAIDFLVNYHKFIWI